MMTNKDSALNNYDSVLDSHCLCFLFGTTNLIAVYCSNKQGLFKVAFIVSFNSAAKEACIVTQLKHPNIVRVFGVTWWNNCFGIVMEEINGGCLEDLLFSKVELPWKIRLKIVLELAKALEHLHCAQQKKAFVHGDIKPQNILLTDELVTKLVDFGSLNIVQSTGASTATIDVSSSQHTPYYSAPEVLKNPGTDRKTSADIYRYVCE